ncbi:hypothetical protein Tco_0206932 [Tanacetum coccineum]
MVVQNQSELGEGSANPTDPHYIPIITQSSTQPQKIQKPRKPKRKDTQVPQPSDPSENVADEAIHKELGDSLVRAATTASSLEAEQDSGNITKTRSKATPNESSFLGTTSGGVPGAKKPWGILLLKLVLDLEKTKTTQQNEIDSLKRRVKKLEKKDRSRTHKLKRLNKVGLTARVESSGDEEDLGEDASKQGRRINAIDANEDITLVNVQDDADNEMFDVNVLNAYEEESSIVLDEEAALKLLAKFDEEERLAREKAEKEKEANIALIEEWDDIQAKIDDDHQLAEKLQAQEQEELVGGRKRNESRRRADAKEYKEAKDEEKIAIDVIPLAVKSLWIVDWKIHKEGNKIYYQIVRADGKSQMYMIFSQMLKSFDKEDLEDLYKLVKARYGSTRPVESMDYLLWNDMKTMFEPHSMQIYMLVEKKYPLTPPTLSMMLEKKLQIDSESEMAYQMCKLIKKQLKK